MKPGWLLLMSAVLATFGQIFFKRGVTLTGEVTFQGPLAGELSRLLFNPLIFSGLIVYIASAIIWLVALSRTTLNFSYPFTALTFVFVMLAARLIFVESIPPLRITGIVLICLGFLLSSLA